MASNGVGGPSAAFLDEPASPASRSAAVRRAATQLPSSPFRRASAAAAGPSPTRRSAEQGESHSGAAAAPPPTDAAPAVSPQPPRLCTLPTSGACKAAPSSGPQAVLVPVAVVESARAESTSCAAASAAAAAFAAACRAARMELRI